MQAVPSNKMAKVSQVRSENGAFSPLSLPLTLLHLSIFLDVARRSPRRSQDCSFWHETFAFLALLHTRHAWKQTEPCNCFLYSPFFSLWNENLKAFLCMLLLEFCTKTPKITWGKKTNGIKFSKLKLFGITKEKKKRGLSLASKASEAEYCSMISQEREAAATTTIVVHLRRTLWAWAASVLLSSCSLSLEIVGGCLAPASSS